MHRVLLEAVGKQVFKGKQSTKDRLSSVYDKQERYGNTQLTLVGRGRARGHGHNNKQRPCKATRHMLGEEGLTVGVVLSRSQASGLTAGVSQHPQASCTLPYVHMPGIVTELTIS